MSPEQAASRHSEVGPRADVYAIGAVLYSLLTGRPPFSAAGLIQTLHQVIEQEPVAPATLNPAVDHDLSVICQMCLEKLPQRRYASARELAEDLRRFLNHQPIRARATTSLERCRRWCRRKPLVASLLAGVGLLCVGLMIFAAWHFYALVAITAGIATTKPNAEYHGSAARRGSCVVSKTTRNRPSQQSRSAKSPVRGRHSTSERRTATQRSTFRCPRSIARRRFRPATTS